MQQSIYEFTIRIYEMYFYVRTRERKEKKTEWRENEEAESERSEVTNATNDDYYPTYTALVIRIAHYQVNMYRQVIIYIVHRRSRF